MRTVIVNGVEISYLDVPYTKDEILEKTICGAVRIEGVIAVSLNEILGNDIEGFNDIICERLISAPYLQDIYYTTINATGQDIFIKVDAWVDVEEMF